MKKLKLTEKLETKRLIIEMPKLEDTKELISIIDKNVTEFMSWWIPDNKIVIENNINETIKKCNDWKSWETLIRKKDNNKIIWRFWIIKFDEEVKSIELGYWVWSDYWGKWYIPECVEYIKAYWFNILWVNRIVIIATKENIKSRKVAEKCWFKLDWILRWEADVKWVIVDNAVYTFLKKDFIN